MAEGGAVALSETLALYHGDRKKLGLDFHEIGLVVDDGINVLVGTRGFLHIVLATDSVEIPFASSVLTAAVRESTRPAPYEQEQKDSRLPRPLDDVRSGAL